MISKLCYDENAKQQKLKSKHLIVNYFSLVTYKQTHKETKQSTLKDRKKNCTRVIILEYPYIFHISKYIQPFDMALKSIMHVFVQSDTYQHNKHFV